jgi:uncharacterized membrane protein (DUF4010 family)
MEFYKNIPQDLINFILVTIFALLIGLEQKNLHKKIQKDELFGTDRTFALIGILGFILYLLNPKSLIPFLVGFIIISSLVAIFYYFKLKNEKSAGFTSIIALLITYTIAPLLYTQPHWLLILIVIGVLILLEIKKNLLKFSKKIKHKDFITLAKFLIIAGVILPLLPNKPVLSFINVSPYKFWLAIVAISSISYISYLLQKYIFKEAGYLLTGILGGLYSSTATTIVLAKKSNTKEASFKIVAAILLATAIMYLRIVILAFIFNKVIAINLLKYFIPLFIISILLGLFFGSKEKTTLKNQLNPSKNPLEFNTAFVFGLLFIVFAKVTELVMQHYGNSGVHLLSLVVGLTDIDPFILNLFQSETDIIDVSLIISATVIATASNGFIKMIYAIVLGSKKLRFSFFIAFMALTISSIILILAL